MPTVRCPACDATVREPQAAPGTTVICPECGERFTAGDAPTGAFAASDPGEATGPRPRRRRDWGDPEEPVPEIRKKGTGRNTVLLIGGILVALFLVCGGLAMVAGFFIVRTIEENEARRQLAIQQQQRNQQHMQNIQRANQPPQHKRVPPPLDDAARKAAAIPLKLENAAVTHQNTLTPADPPFTGKPFKAYTVDLEPGKRYQVELASKQMDSFLRLYGPNDEPLLENDDFRGLDSGIVYTPDAAGTYKIHATVLGRLNNNRPAPFTLTIRAE